MRYILYARKSSESEDRQIQSIDDQLRVLREFANVRGLTIVEEITESKSAKAPGNRPDFEKMLKRIEKEEADGILCWSINRLTRNPIDSGKLSWMLQNNALKVIQTPEKQYLPTDNVLILSVETGTANQFIIDLKRNVERGTETKLMQGWFPHRAPEGYFNDRNTRTILPDGERFLLIQRAWRLVIAGTHSPAKVIELLNEEWGYRTQVRTRRKDGTPHGGGKISRSAGYRIFTNLFYTGYFRHRGQVYKGSHQPMITLAEFETVQKRLRSQGGLVRYRKHDFPYKGLMRCARCGHVITPERQSGRHGRGNWIYYHCSNKQGMCSRRSIREDVLEERIAACLSTITITPEFKEIVKDALEKWITEEFGAQESVYTRQMHTLSETEAMLNELVGLRLKQLVSDSVFQTKQRELEDTVSTLRLSIGRTQEKLDHTRRIINNALDFSLCAEGDFLTGSAEKRREIAQALGIRYVLNEGKIFIEMNPLLQYLQAAEKAQFEPPQNNSDNTKKTSSDEKVQVGATDGMQIEPLNYPPPTLPELFRKVAVGDFSFVYGRSSH